MRKNTKTVRFNVTLISALKLQPVYIQPFRRKIFTKLVSFSTMHINGKAVKQIIINRCLSGHISRSDLLQ